MKNKASRICRKIQQKNHKPAAIAGVASGKPTAAPSAASSKLIAAAGTASNKPIATTGVVSHRKAAVVLQRSRNRGYNNPSKGSNDFFLANTDTNTQKKVTITCV